MSKITIIDFSRLIMIDNIKLFKSFIRIVFIYPYKVILYGIRIV